MLNFGAVLDGGFYFLISILTWGDDPIWRYNIFQMGWNHQLDYFNTGNFYCCNLSVYQHLARGAN